MRSRLLMAVLAVLAGAGTIRGQCEITEIQKITAFDGAADDAFGIAVDVDGWLAVVGAYSDDLAVADTGAAYIYYYDGSIWRFGSKLLPSRRDAPVGFGACVAIEGNLLVVGAPGDGPGFVDVFRHDGASWGLEATLTASDGKAGDRFGHSVSLDGDRVLVGAQNDDDAGTDSGSAYLYRYDRTGWLQEARLSGSDSDVSDLFGSSVSLHGDLALVGAIGWDERGVQIAGAAYLFRYDGRSWIEETQLVAGDGIEDRAFGVSVLVREATALGDIALVGAFRDDELGANAGAAYFFQHDGRDWTKVQKLFASDGDADDLFGRRLDLDEDLLLVGAYTKGRGGAAYTYRFTGKAWTDLLKLTASDAESGDLFGTAVALDDDFAFVGAIDEDSVGSDAGATYFYPARRQLQLLALPRELDPGDVLCCLTYYGYPGSAALLALVEVDGVPVFRPLVLGAFQFPSFTFPVCGAIPGSLADLDLTFQSLGFNMCGEVSITNKATVTIR